MEKEISDEERFKLTQQDAASRVRERVLTFPDEETYLQSIKAVIELSQARQKQVRFRPLGGLDDHMTVVDEEDFPTLEAIFSERGLLFENQKIRSMGELTAEESREVKRYGRRIG